MANITGFIGINKPRGVSSSQVVSRVRFLLSRHLNRRVKVGHMGTLDVDAEGVLVLGIGAAAKLFDYYLSYKKTYKSIFKFGYDSDTNDTTGNVIKKGNVPDVKKISSCIQQIKNQNMQIPPKFSALSVGGKKAYNVAREKGVSELELAARPIKIYCLKLLKQVDETSFLFEIECSSGTYIRAIARDLGNILSTYCITSKIIRTKSCYYTLNNTLEFDKLTAKILIDSIVLPNDVLGDIMVISLKEQQCIDLLNGKLLKKQLKDGTYFVKSLTTARKTNGVDMLAECKNNFLKIKINFK